MYKFDVPFKLTSFAQELPNEFIDKLIDIAISHTNSKHASKRVKMLFDTACRNEFQVKGFRNASGTSVPLLVKKPLVDSIKRSEPIIWAVVNVWLEARQDLCLVSKDFLEKSNIPYLDLLDLKYGFDYAVVESEMDALVCQLEEIVPSVDQDELKLMLTLLQGKVPLSEEEIKDYAGVNLDTMEVSSIPVAQSMQPLFDDNTVRLTLPHVKMDIIAVDKTPLSSSEFSKNGEKFKDTVTALNSLSGKLGKAKDLLTNGNLEKLNDWAGEFEQSVQNALLVWEKDRIELRNYADSVISSIRKTGIHDPDKEDFVNRVNDAISKSKNNPHQLQKTKKTIDEISQEANKHAQQIEIELANLAQSQRIVEEALRMADEWELNSEAWRTQSVTVEAGQKQSRDEVTRGIKINKDLAKQIQDAIDGSRANLIASLLKQCSELISLANDEQKVRIKKINEKVPQCLTRIDLTSFEKDLLTITQEINSLQAMPSVEEAAQMYQKEHDTFYLDVLLDGLVKNRRHGDVYLLLSLLLLKGIWKTGSNLEKPIADSYFMGFRDHIPAADLFSNLVAFLKETQLVYQTKVEDPKVGLGLAILYLSALAVEPKSLNPNDLWQIYTDDIKNLSPVWGNLLEQTLQGNLPVIRDSSTLPADELKVVISFLDADLYKENGRYVRSRGKNSIVMTNMEQQQLLPLLDEKWQKLKNMKMGTESWEQIKKWLSETDASFFYESVCRTASLDPNESTFYRSNFEERIQKDLQYFDKYIRLKEEIDGLKTANFVLIEDALDALASLQNGGVYLNDSYLYIAQSILSYLGSGSIPVIKEDLTFSPALEKSLLESPEFWISVPDAVAYVGSYDTLVEDGRHLVDVMVKSFVENRKGEVLAEFYLHSNLPHIAESVHTSPDVRKVAADLRQKNKEGLQTRLAELKKWKEALSKQEEQWCASQRWNLLFSRIDARLESLRNEELKSDERLREKFAELVKKANDLELLIMDAGFLPPASRDELNSALDEVKKVCRNRYAQGIDLADGLLAEIKHVLDYQDSNIEGVNRAHIDLNEALYNKRQSRDVDPSSLTIGKYIESLRSGNYEAINITRSIYSENMIDDRIDLLNLWVSIKGYPNSLQTEAQSQDLRHFFSLFAKIVSVMYGAETSSKTSHHFFRTPVPHFESNLMKPGTDALNRNLVFLALTEDFNHRSLRELDAIMSDEKWLAFGFVVWFVLDHAEIAHDWVRRKYNGKSVIVIDEEILLKILFAGDNPTSTGYFKRMLLRTVDTHSVSVFWYENFVDKDKSIFVGREDWIRSIVESGRSHAIYGGRRIGKSSLLKAVERELNKTGVTCVYIDLEGARSLKEGISAAQDILERLEIYDTCESLTDFQRLLTKHFQKNPERKVVILFDELDPYIRERRRNKEPHTLIDTCRNLFQEHRSNIRFIMAGFTELWKQLRGDGDFIDQQNPYMNFLYDRGPLAALQSSDAQKIVKEGFQETLGFKISDPSIPRRIVDITTGHPAFVQKFCERLFNHLHSMGSDITEVQLRDVEFVKDEAELLSFTRFVVETLDLNLNNLSQIIVYLLAANNGEDFNVDDIYSLLHDFGISKLTKEKIHESVQELLITGVLSTSQNRYKFSVPSYANLLRQYDLTDTHYLLNLIEKYNASA
jgi:hypothetical protein